MHATEKAQTSHRVAVRTFGPSSYKFISFVGINLPPTFSSSAKREPIFILKNQLISIAQLEKKKVRLLQLRKGGKMFV